MTHTSHTIKSANGTAPATTQAQPDIESLVDQSAEEATVGAVLLGGTEVFERCDNVLGGDAENFGLLRLRYIWQTFQRLHARKQAIDVMTVHSDLEARNVLDDLGGMSELVRLSNNVATDIYGEVYAGIVKGIASRRKMLIVSDKLRPLALELERPVQEVIQDAESLLLDISARHIERRGRWLAEAMKDETEEIRRLMREDGNGMLGVTTGLRDYDNLMLGFEQDRFYVLAGRPGMGKSALAICNLLEAAKQGPAIFHTCEMSEAQVRRRLIAIISGVNTKLQQMPKLMTKAQMASWVSARDYLATLPIWIEDKARPTPREIKVVSQGLVRRYGAKAIFIDGIYRMKSDIPRTKSHEMYGDIAEGLKTLSRELSVPVIATHQLNRNLESRPDKKPTLADLRESGRIEEEADVVTFIYRHGMYDETTPKHDTDLIVAKNRDGSTGSVKVFYEETITKFVNAKVTSGSLNGDEPMGNIDLSNL